MRKFSQVSTDLGSSMKSVGEVMAIDRKFESAFSKAVRMVDDDMDGFGNVPAEYMELEEKELESRLENPDDKRVWAIGAAMKRGYTVERIHELTRIDRWFLCKLLNIIELETTLNALEITQVK